MKVIVYLGPKIHQQELIHSVMAEGSETTQGVGNTGTTLQVCRDPTGLHNQTS